MRIYYTGCIKLVLLVIVNLSFVSCYARSKSYIFIQMLFYKQQDTLSDVKKRKLYWKHKSMWAGRGKFACPLLLIMDSIWNSLKSLNDTLSGADRIFQLYCPTLSPPTYERDPYGTNDPEQSLPPLSTGPHINQHAVQSRSVCLNNTTAFISFRLNR
jgi:hypothetical protein